MQIITRVYIYKELGKWYYSAWAGDEYDHSDEVDASDYDTLEEVTAVLHQLFPQAEVADQPCRKQT
jgi:hypothetical protein